MILPHRTRHYHKLASPGYIILGLAIAAIAPAKAESDSVTMIPLEAGAGGNPSATAPAETSPAQKPAPAPDKAASTPDTPAPRRAAARTPARIEAAPDDPKGEIVELPRYVVTDSRILPMPESWRYASLPGFEILSNARDFTTRGFLKDFQMLQAAIDVVWPTLTVHRADTPTILILCARDNAFSQFVPDGDSNVFITPTSLFVEDKERGAIVIDFTLQTLFDSSIMNELSVVGQPTPIDTDDFAGDTSAETTNSTLPVNDPYAQFYRQYSRFLMRRANGNTPIPDWLEEGLSQLFTTLDFRNKWIEFGKVEHGFGENDAAPRISPQETVRPIKETPISGEESSGIGRNIGGGQSTNQDRRTRFGYIMPLNVMFNPAPSKTSDYRWVEQWKKQCFAFTHMCLYGMNKKYQKAFLTFSRKACAGPVTEDDFKQCFKQSYKQMAARLASHVDSVSQESVLFKAKRGMEGLPDPKPVELREATQAEIGRIKGEVLRLAGHNDASREALIVPYLRKERDAGLFASLGLLETLENRKDRARKFLEAAARENVVRPRAYVELARLRLEEALAAPAGENDKLDLAQTASVLDPLFKARDQPPAMEDVYSLIARTWLCSEVTPKETHLGVLLEGTLRFPKNIGLLEQAATLYSLHGDKSTAATLIKLGSKISPNPQTREKFESLRENRNKHATLNSYKIPSTTNHAD